MIESPIKHPSLGVYRIDIYLRRFFRIDAQGIKEALYFARHCPYRFFKISASRTAAAIAEFIRILIKKSGFLYVNI